MRKIFLILGFFFISAASVNAQDNSMATQTQVLMKMLGLKNALIAKDSVSLSNLLSDEVTYGHTNGLIQTKAQLIRSVVSKEQDYKSIEPSDMKIRVYDKTAVVTMKSDVNMNFENKPLTLHMFVTLVWVMKDKDWKLVARQSVKQ